MFDLTQGTIHLDHFKFLRPLFAEVEVVVVFTKFLNSKNDNYGEIINEIDDPSEEAILQYLMDNTIKILKEQIEQFFPRVKIFIFDSGAKNEK